MVRYEERPGQVVLTVMGLTRAHVMSVHAVPTATHTHPPYHDVVHRVHTDPTASTHAGANVDDDIVDTDNPMHMAVPMVFVDPISDSMPGSTVSLMRGGDEREHGAALHDAEAKARRSLRQTALAVGAAQWRKVERRVGCAPPPKTMTATIEGRHSNGHATAATNSNGHAAAAATAVTSSSSMPTITASTTTTPRGQYHDASIASAVQHTRDCEALSFWMLAALGTTVRPTITACWFISTSTRRRLHAVTALWLDTPPVTPVFKRAKRPLTDTTVEGVQALQRCGGLKPLPNVLSLREACANTVAVAAADEIGYLRACVQSLGTDAVNDVVRRVSSLGALSHDHLLALSGSALSRLLIFGAPLAATRHLDALVKVPLPFVRHLELHGLPWLKDPVLIDVLAALPLLVGLSLDRCSRVTDTSLVQALPHLPNLRHLCVRGTSVSTPTFEQCPRGLESLDASGLRRPFNNRDVAALHTTVGCQSLSTVHLTTSHITSTGMAQLFECTTDHIRTLSLSFNDRIEAWLPGLTLLPTVTDLDLSHNSTIDDGVVLGVCAAMPHLVYLNLEKANVTSGCARGLQRLTQLRHLDLKRTSMDDGLGLALPHLPHLSSLMLTYTAVTDDLMPSLGSLTSLRTLKLTGCVGIGDIGIARLCAHPTIQASLHGLDIGGGDLSNDVVPHLSLLTHLESLQLWETRVTTRLAHRLASQLHLMIDDQIKCTQGTWIMLSRLRLQGRSDGSVVM